MHISAFHLCITSEGITDKAPQREVDDPDQRLGKSGSIILLYSIVHLPIE